MLDAFDLALLNQVQCDGARTAESLSRDVPLSPSAISRRLKRLRREGWLARTIALLGPKLTQNRLRVLVLVRMRDVSGRLELERQLASKEAVQFCYQVAGPHDLAAMFDCASMAEFTNLEHELLESSPAVRRWESLFIKQEVKFAPFIELKA